MQTQYNVEQLEFSCVGRRRVVAAFDGGQFTSDAGALLRHRVQKHAWLRRQLKAIARGAPNASKGTAAGQR
jgi:hypothetical protein